MNIFAFFRWALAVSMDLTWAETGAAFAPFCYSHHTKNNMALNVLRLYEPARLFGRVARALAAGLRSCFLANRMTSAAVKAAVIRSFGVVRLYQVTIRAHIEHAT